MSVSNGPNVAYIGAIQYEFCIWSTRPPDLGRSLSRGTLEVSLRKEEICLLWVRGLQGERHSGSTEESTTASHQRWSHASPLLRPWRMRPGHDKLELSLLPTSQLTQEGQKPCFQAGEAMKTSREEANNMPLSLQPSSLRLQLGNEQKVKCAVLITI